MGARLFIMYVGEVVQGVSRRRCGVGNGCHVCVGGRTGGMEAAVWGRNRL